jgi:hypothetical protein
MTCYPLIGQAKLMEMMFAGDDLSATAAMLIDAAQSDPENAEALLDLSTILLLRGDHAVGLNVQLEALSLKQQFVLQHSPQEGTGIRLLVLKTPGDFMANSPIEFLIRSPHIEADVLYVAPDLPYPTSIPHDLVFNGISEGKHNLPTLKMATQLIKQWGKPYINRAEEVPLLSRDRACEILDGLPGTYMPQNLLLDRDEVVQMGQTSSQLGEFLVQDRFPILIRPVDSHAGQGLQQLSSHDEMAEYLKAQNAEQFYVSPFVDYRSSDGQFRKYRIAFIAGKPFVCHMAISDHWMIHYLNAGMTESQLKRSEEADAMLQFDQKFGLRHEDALSAVGTAFDLDYFAVDCAETPDGQLLIFEAGNAMVVHDMDPVAMFPYKKPLMQALFREFQSLLFDKAKLHTTTNAY